MRPTRKPKAIRIATGPDGNRYELAYTGSAYYWFDRNGNIVTLAATIEDAQARLARAVPGLRAFWLEKGRDDVRQTA